MAGKTIVSHVARYNNLSSIILVATDWVNTGVNIGSTLVFPVVGTIVTNTFIALAAGILVFFNEWYESRNIVESFLDGAIASFIVWLPTPIAGTLVGGISVGKNQGLIK